jgi:arabinogalactan oligomer / maltooligosaccharide transport system substrate-binding protein
VKLNLLAQVGRQKPYGKVIHLKISKRSILASSAIFAASALVLSGCAASTDNTGGADPEPTVDSITIWADDMVAKSLEGVAARFETETGVAVNLVIKDFGSIRDEAITAIPTGQGPDIFAGAHDWTGQLVAAGVVAPLELGAKSADFRENALAAFTYDAALYGMPFGVENIALVCNSEKVPTQPATWAELVSAGVEIAMGADSGDPYHFYPLQTSFGASVFVQDASGSYTSELGMDNDQGREFAKWLYDEGSKVFKFKEYGDVENEMKTGVAACWITGPWAAPSIAEGLGEDGYSIYSIPSIGGETPVQFLGARGFYISSKTQDQLYVQKFLVDYIGTADVQKEIYDIGGRIPAHKEAFAAAADDKITKGFGDAGVNAQPMPAIPAMGSVWASWGSTQAALLQKKGDPTELWDKMNAEIKAAIG